MEMPRSRTLPDLLDEMAARHPDGEAGVGASDRLTYRAWRARARELAKGLLRLGVRRGDKVALLMPNRPEWLIVDFAVAMTPAVSMAHLMWRHGESSPARHRAAKAGITVDLLADAFAVHTPTTRPAPNFASSTSNTACARSSTRASSCHS